MIDSLVASGLFVGVAVVGLKGLRHLLPGSHGVPGIALSTAIGMTIWTVPLMGALIARAYTPALLGAAAWVVVAVIWWHDRHSRPLAAWQRFGRPQPEHVILLVGLGLAFAVYILFPADPTTTVRDMAVYALHADYMATAGRLDIPYPEAVASLRQQPPGWVEYAGVYRTDPTMTVQFGHAYPAWLAQVFGVFGFDGVTRANAVVGVLSALLVYGVARTMTPGIIAALTAVALAANPSQIWVVHNTLTEILTQFLLWSALLVLVIRPAAQLQRAGFVAGALFGMAAFVRIDVLVVVPLLAISHALIRIMNASGPTARQFPMIWLGAAPLFTLAVAYYASFSTPYFTHLLPQLRLIGVAGAGGLLLLALTWVPVLRRSASRLAPKPTVLGIVVAAVLGLAVYGYFIRPYVEPFDLTDGLPSAIAGTRTHVEDAMRNVAAYVSPPVFWVGLLAWLGALVVSVHRRDPRWLALIVVTGGFAALYFWNMSIRPDHPWAIRRFVPLVIPAILIFAGVGVSQTLRRSPRRLASAVVLVLTLGISAYTLRVAHPAAVTPERAGTYRGIETLAAELPSGVPYVGIFDRAGVRSMGTALALAFDIDLIPIDATNEPGRTELIDRLTQATAERPVLIITNLMEDLDLLVGADLGRMEHQQEFITPTLRPVPSANGTQRLALAARIVTGLATAEATYGGSSSWWVSGTGFYPVEQFVEGRARWTDGEASVLFPALGDEPMRRVVIDLLPAGPAGMSLTVLLNGATAYEGVTTGGPQVIELDVPPDMASNALDVRIQSDTFVPADSSPESADTRSLGVLVRGVNASTGSQ